MKTLYKIWCLLIYTIMVTWILGLWTAGWIMEAIKRCWPAKDRECGAIEGGTPR